MYKLNVGCGGFPLRGYTNIDEAPGYADMVLHVPPLPFPDGSVQEIYGGHFFEHLERPEALEFLKECYRTLASGGLLSLLVPDTKEVMRRYVLNKPAPIEFPAGVHRDLRDLDDMCATVIFSTSQDSLHHWVYDDFTLGRVMQNAGFVVTGRMDPGDERIAMAAWYQFGLNARKP